jgi:anti-anti-sigma factor
MQITQSSLGDARVLSAKGRLDADSASELEERCNRLIQSGVRSMVLNLTGLEYLSSAGLRVVLSASKELQALEGKLILIAPEGGVRQIITAAGFDKVLTVCTSLEEAGKHTTGNFRIVTSKDWDVDILTLYGRVDAERSPQVEAAGKQILDAGHLKLIVNLSAVEYLSSAGLCAFLNLGKFAQARKSRLFLCGPRPDVKRVLELSGFDKIFPLCETVDEALVK